MQETVLSLDVHAKECITDYLNITGLSRNGSVSPGHILNSISGHAKYTESCFRKHDKEIYH